MISLAVRRRQLALACSRHLPLLAQEANPTVLPRATTTGRANNGPNDGRHWWRPGPAMASDNIEATLNSAMPPSKSIRKRVH